MRVLVVSQYYTPEPFLIHRVVERLQNDGADVTVLTGKPNYPEGEIYEGYRSWGLQSEAIDGIEVLRVPSYARGKNSAIRLVLNYFAFIASACIFGPWLVRGKAFDTVFVYAPSPILQALPAIFIARLKKAHLVLWVQDLWPESLSATGYVSNKTVLGIVRQIVKFIYARCDRILAQSYAFLPAIQALTADKEKICVLYNPANDVRHDTPPSPEVVNLANEIASSFTVLFAGNMGRAQGLDTVVAAAKILRENAGIKFALVGDGRELEHLKSEVSSLQLPNVIFPGRFPAEAMPALMGSASALLATLRDDPTFALTVPSKIQSYFAAGRPVIAAINGEGARLVEEAGAGTTVEAENAAQLAEAILQMSEISQTARDKMGLAGRAYFEANFETNQIVGALADHLEFKD